MRILLVTAPPDAGEPLLRQLVEAEVLLVMETSAEGIEAKITQIQALHPYEVPKIVAFEPGEALAAYVAWVREHS